MKITRALSAAPLAAPAPLGSALAASTASEFGARPNLSDETFTNIVMRSNP